MILAHLALLSTNWLQPHGIGVEDTYTITSVMKILPPIDPAVMTDPYQDTIVVGHEGKAILVSITYFPLNDRVRKLRETRYATKSENLRRYLAPTATCNWDASMRAKLLAELEASGIHRPNSINRNYVQQIANWAFAKSRFDGNGSAMPPDWYVAFQDHRATVMPDLREAFNASKPSAKLTDRQVFARQLLGRDMFEGKVHGQCTSSSIYLATILRAAGVPTRILYFVPPCDANDPKQLAKLTGAISHQVLRAEILGGASQCTGFANHMFDEVWLEGRWVRLNYSRLDQPIADQDYLGLQTHIVTCADIEETHLAETWGRRIVRWPKVDERLTSINPYMLLATRDHWGRHASLANPPVPELEKGTIFKTAWTGTPAFHAMTGPDYDKAADVLLFTREWIDGQNYMQMRKFVANAAHEFLLSAPRHASVRLEYTLNTNKGNQRAYGFKINPADRVKLARGVAYALTPLNRPGNKPWIVEHGVAVTLP